MLPTNLKQTLTQQIQAAEHPCELAIDVMMAIQDHYGHLSDEAMEEAAAIVGVDPLKLDELATFYTFLYREPVGKYVIHVCDSVLCWMDGAESLADHLQRKLGVDLGETSQDGLFTLLPVCCIGYCDRSPAILINKQAYGPLTFDKLDEIIETLKSGAADASPPHGAE